MRMPREHLRNRQGVTVLDDQAREFLGQPIQRIESHSATAAANFSGCLPENVGSHSKCLVTVGTLGIHRSTHVSATRQKRPGLIAVDTIHRWLKIDPAAIRVQNGIGLSREYA